MSRSGLVVPDTVPSTDEVTLQLHDLGGSGPPLLLCHATGLCGPVWQPVADVLGRHFRCVALDFRAHGRSTPPAERPLVWSGMADDVLAVVDALSPGEPIAAVGHSMGGTSLVLAERRRPGTLARAWTFEPILFDRPSDHDRPTPSDISRAARVRRATFASREEALARFKARLPLSRLDPRALRAYVDHGFEELTDGSVILRCRPEHEAEVFEYHHSGARSLVGGLAIPFLMAVGGDGRPPVQEVISAAADFPHLELARYDHLTHFGPLEDPDGVADDMAAWLTT